MTQTTTTGRAVHSTAPSHAFQRCINGACAAVYPIESTLVACPGCGNLLDVDYDWAALPRPTWGTFDSRSSTCGPRSAAGTFPSTPAMLDFSGVWRFRDLLPFYRSESQIVTIGEGRTNLQKADQLARALGFDPVARAGAGGLYLQYEGFNPSGSFKDNGMTAAFTHAKMVGATRVACASTGNTSAALAVYGSVTGTQCFVFIGDGKIAYGKLSQALDYGATTLQIAGDFDACLARIRHIAEHMPQVGVYLMNSVNPFRLEGQKAIMYRVLEGLNWEVPDWVIVPGGNLGNCSAFGKAFIELRALGLIRKVPRLAVVQAAGSRTLDRIVNELGVVWAGGAGSLAGTWDMRAVDAEYARMDAANERARTLATAIEINRPVNLPKALRALHAMNGVVRSVPDEVIVEHKAMVGRYGFGCEPASAASVAGARLLLNEGVIRPDERVVCVLTGHQLKDPDVTVGYHTRGQKHDHHAQSGGDHKAAAIAGALGAYVNAPIRVADDLDAILKAMGV
ncbi:MAG: threonine synthase [Phycisphaerales bacterium]